MALIIDTSNTSSSTNIIFQFDFFSQPDDVHGIDVLAYMELRICMYVMHIRCEIHAPHITLPFLASQCENLCKNKPFPTSL